MASVRNDVAEVDRKEASVISEETFCPPAGCGRGEKGKAAEVWRVHHDYYPRTASFGPFGSEQDARAFSRVYLLLVPDAKIRVEREA